MQGTETEALAPGSLPQELSPTWRVMLLSDGSVTRHMALLTQSDVQVACLGMDPLPAGAAVPGPAAAVMDGDLLIRKVDDAAPALRSGGVGAAEAAASGHGSRRGDGLVGGRVHRIIIQNQGRDRRSCDRGLCGLCCPAAFAPWRSCSAAHPLPPARASQVFLKTGQAKPLVFARSWWRTAEVESYLRSATVARG